jgi:hypothetical protein
MRLAALQSIMSIKVVGILGYLRPPRTRCFQRRGGLSSMPSPVPLRDWVHPLLSCTSPTEYVLQISRLARMPNSSQGSFPLRDMSMWSPQSGGLPKTHLSFALSVSHALDDFLLHTPCGLVSSHSHVRDSHFRGFPCCQADSLHQRPVPS